MKKAPALPFERAEGYAFVTFLLPACLLVFTQYEIIWLAAISSHCLAALPANMPAFNSHMRQNTYCRNLK